MSQEKARYILLIAARKQVQQQLGEHLRGLGHRVEEAYQVLYALQLVRGLRLDLVMVDMAIPERDIRFLLDALGRLRPELPVAVLAGGGRGERDSAVWALGLGAVEALERLLDQEEVDTFLQQELQLREDDALEWGGAVVPGPPPTLSPVQEALESRLEELCHEFYRDLSWLERTLEFCQAFDLARRCHMGMLHTFFQQMGPRWNHPAWFLFNRARRQADVLGVDYPRWVDAQLRRVQGQSRRELLPADLQGWAAARTFQKKGT